MKSHIDTVLTIYDGILKDATVRWPELVGSFEMDYSYLRRAASERGLEFFTLVLPAVGKHLDKMLSSGTFDRVGFPQGYPISQKRANFLFCDLFSKVFGTDNKLLPDVDSEAIAFLRQLFYCCKKYRLSCKEDIVSNTIDSFYETDASLPYPHPRTFLSEDPVWPRLVGHPLRDYFQDDGSEHDKRWIYLRFVADVIISNIGVPEYWELTGRHGPGVVAEGKAVVNKYDFPSWPRRLQAMFPFEWFGSGILDTEHNYNEVESLSRLIAVPKTQKGPRLICAEPLCHQWIQQSIWRWLAKRIPRSILGRVITFDSQENSRNRALYASMSGSLATIDLSEASDRLSCRLVQYIFGQNQLLDYMWACRTKGVSQSLSSKQPSSYLFNKFAPMGSALTFPVQSIVFAIMSIASYMLSSDMELKQSSVRKAADMVTVFGDDIIVPVSCLSHLRDIFTECRLKINDAKTFSEGNFRESCGMDAYNGVDVTPAYVLQSYDGSPTSIATVVEMSNNFFKRGFWNASHAIVEMVPPAERKLLRVTSSDDEGLGLFSYCGSSDQHLKRVWDRDLQREYSIALGLRSKCKKVRGRDNADLTQFFIEDPSSQPLLTRESWEAGQIGRLVIQKTRVRVPS